MLNILTQQNNTWPSCLPLYLFTQFELLLNYCDLCGIKPCFFFYVFTFLILKLNLTNMSYSPKTGFKDLQLGMIFLEWKHCPLWTATGNCTCLHLAVHSCRSIQHQTFDLEKLIRLVTSDHREAEATVTLLQLRVDEGSFELSWVSGEERLPSCTTKEDLSQATIFLNDCQAPVISLIYWYSQPQIPQIEQI